ncbi:peptidase T [Holzapfeliella floricola]|uniref:Peptidase T n=1 Tax=Holzapfeliella floricola DSM 23037 = JCM 16512 TaxID=1423744 RepID=A0A0R2DTE8_9LACO|nr:peptidase T [Holzapfeliella floricola]KRN03756.1 peptidase T [Holzapfeliella floricola DSM 23037 = JCM 16512]
MKYNDLTSRFLKYVKQNTRSDENSSTVPSTQRQVDFLNNLRAELEEIGLSDIFYNEKNGYLTATIESTTDKDVPTIGFISHVDTADFNSENIQPQLIENYDGVSAIKLGESGFYLDPKEFNSLNKYEGHTLITTDGTTLLGADDKSGVAEIVTFADYLIKHPEIEHGKIRIAFGPDEEIGTGANLFDVDIFDADFAYTVDGGPEGELEYETFNAASLKVEIQGKNVHPSTAYGVMVNASLLAIEFNDRLPKNEVPEKTKDREGFFLLTDMSGNVDQASLSYIIRDFEKDGLTRRKELAHQIANEINESLDTDRVSVTIQDQYANMYEVMKDHMYVVDLAREAMHNLDIETDEKAVRGGTDGSKISFMGLPTPNLFAGGENMHGRYEYVSVQVMEKAVDVLLEIATLNTKGEK